MTQLINELRRDARNIVRELGLLNDAYFDIGVTLAERHLLIELEAFPNPTMGEIAERLLLDKSTVSRLISKAVKKGYVDCITDKDDKRKRHLQMTKKGKEVLHAFEPIAFDQTKNALLTLSQEEIETVYKGIKLYAQGLKTSRQWTLRLFDPKDEQELYAIFQEVVDSGLKFPYQSSSIEEFRKHFQGQVWVCQASDGKIVGGFYLKPNSPHIANAAYMVHKSYRGQGIGTALIKASLNLAKNQGFHTMQYNQIFSENKGAVRLYEKLGFHITKTFENFYVMQRGLK